MGRGAKGGKPFRFFWNKSDAIATNVYLLLFPKPQVANCFRERPELGREVVNFLSETGLEELLGHGRVYGGGLYKLEPKELGRLNAEQLAARLGVTGSSRSEQLGLAFGT